MRINKRLSRYIAWIFITILCIEGIPVSAFAAEVQAENQIIEETAVSENEIDEKETDEDEVNEAEITENEDAEGTASSDQISVNGISADEISVNSASSDFISSEAREALQKLASDQQMMALVYHGSSYDMKEQPDRDSNTIATLKSGELVFIEDVAFNEEDSTLWYQVRTATDEQTGYIEKYYLAYSDERLLEWEATYLTYDAAEILTAGVDYSDIAEFPASYQSKLITLKNSHNAWTFVPYEVDIDWSDAVSAQNSKNRSWIWKTAPENYRGSLIPDSLQKDNSTSKTWYYATKAAIEYYMDPRNSLTETNIFAHELLTYNSSYQSESGVQSMLNATTYMTGKIPQSSQTFANAFWEFGDDFNISPFHLAARVIQEQGVKGTSKIISGEVSGYKGYYNYFNIGATSTLDESSPIINGLKYAVKKGWNSPYKALKGGSEYVANDYVAKKQFTIYLEKFDLIEPYYTHQYMQNIQAHFSEGERIENAYKTAGIINKAFVFKIPVYQNMPSSLTMSPTKATIHKGDTKQLYVKDTGTTVDASKYKWSTSDNTIATVDPTGLVTAIATGADGAVGTCTITATQIADTSVKLTCLVTVDNPITAIHLNISENSLERGDSFKLQVSYEPEDGTGDRTVKWFSKSSSIAWVSGTESSGGINNIGSVSTNKLGTTVITATAAGKTATCQVSVYAEVKEMNLDHTSLELLNGDAIRLQANYYPVYTSDDIILDWSSDNESVATIEDGLVTATGEGTTTVYATLLKGTEREIKASCQVSVRNCNITYYDDNGDVSLVSTAKIGQSFADVPYADGKVFPDAPEKENCTFTGWYTKADGKGEKLSETDLITGDMSIYPYYLELDKGFTVKPIGDYVYTGSAVKPTVYVYDKETLLTLGKDYTVSYKNNTNASAVSGKAIVTVKGKGNYSGIETVEFTIQQKSISASSITVEDLVLARTGKQILSVPVLKYGTKKLSKNKDFSVSYPRLSEEGAYRETGTHPILVTGTGNYRGSRIVYQTISVKVLASKLKVEKIDKRNYTGDTISPNVIVSYQGKILTKDTDYQVVYPSDQISAGKKTLYIKGIATAGYVGTKAVNYTVLGAAINKATVEGITSMQLIPESEGTEYVQSNYRVFCEDRLLTEGTDYVTSYLNNTAKGSATIIFTGIGRFTGSLKKKFLITAYSFAKEGQSQNDGISVFAGGVSENFSTAYQKNGACLELSVYAYGNKLTEGTDYKVSYKNNKAVISATTLDGEEKKLPSVIIKGMGNYTGTITRTFSITQSDFTSVRIEAQDVPYKDKAGNWKGKVTIYDTNGKKLSAGKDYEKVIEYTYTNNTSALNGGMKVNRQAGANVEKEDTLSAETSITVTVRGMGYYSSDAISEIYRITKCGITSAKVYTKSQTYTGDAVTLSDDDINVMIGFDQLEKNVDYIIVENSYSNNVKKGKATFTIQGIGNYGGIKQAKFTILPFAIKWWWN